MFRRILRSTIVLAALIGAYQVYVLFAVPQMEPSLSVRERHQAEEHPAPADMVGDQTG